MPALHGISENGGLVGGGVGNLSSRRRLADDEELRERLDEQCFAIAPSGRPDAAVAARLAQIAPELPTS